MKLITKIVGATLGLAMAVGVGVGVANNRNVAPVYADSFNTTYNYAGQGTTWTATNFEDASSYWKSSDANDSVASVSGIFTGKTITSDVVITSDIACFGSGSNPTSSKFSIYTSSACTTKVTATQGGNLPTSSTYTSATYTVTSSNAAAFSDDLAIKITKGTKQIRFRSFRVAFTYTEGAVANHTLTYAQNTNGSYDGSTQKAFTVVEGGTHTVLNPASVGISANEGYIFTTWNDGSADYAPGSSYTMGTSDVTLTAQWVAGVGLSYNANGGSNAPSTTYVVSGGTQTVASGSGMTAPSGKQFARWNTNSEGTGTSYNAGAEITNFTSSLTLYAVWEDLTHIDFDAANDTGTNSITKGDITMSCSNGVLNNNTEYRIYKNATLTFTRSGGNKIGSIEFTGVSGNPISNLTVSTGTLTPNGDDGVWEGAASTVTFTASVAQARASFIVVNYLVGADVNLDTETLTLSVGGSSSSVGIASISGVTSPSYLWSRTSGDDCVTLSNTTSATVSVAPKGTQFAKCTLTLTVNGSNLQSPITREVAVFVARSSTSGNPYSINEAKNAIDLDNNTYLNEAYAQGVISQIPDEAFESGSLTYWISANGEAENQLQIFKGKGLNGANFESKESIDLGATVVVKGNLKKYNTRYEFDEGSQLMSYYLAPEVQIEKSNTKSSLSYKYTKNGTGDIDYLDRAVTGIEGPSYTYWSGKTSTSGAVYAGQSAGGNSAIQLRSSNNNSGIVTTASCGKNASKVTVVWGSSTETGRTINIYGKDSAYTAATQLYSDSTDGTLLGTIKKGTSTELAITGEYEFIGIRSASGALYLDEVKIQWDSVSYEYSNVAIRFGGSIDPEVWDDLDTDQHNAIAGYGVTFAQTGTFEGLLKDNISNVETARGFYKPVAEKQDRHPDLVGGQYVWNLYLRISTLSSENYTEEYLNDDITAVAYIKLANGDVIFMKETKASVKSLAQDLIKDNTNDYGVTSFDGSLVYLAYL